MKTIYRNEKGFVSVAIVLGMLVLGLFALSSSNIVNNSTTETINNTSQERANYYAMAGIEYALGAINKGEDPAGTKTFDMGTATITVNGSQITSVGKSDVAQVTRSITTAMGGSCVSMSCDNFHSEGTDLFGVYVSKACLSHPIIDRFKVIFTPDNGEKVTAIQINGQNSYSNAVGTGSGTYMDIDNFTIPSNPSPAPVDFIRFTSNITGAKSYTFVAEYTDHSTNQITCVDATAAQVCGNGMPETGEECDDGNVNNGDGCSSNCTVETGYSCNGNPSDCTTLIPEPVCGNASIEDAEACDDGNSNNGDGCSATCVVESGFTCSGSPTSTCSPVYVPVCGNGNLDNGEGCDDANTTDADGCSSTCTVESGYTCSGAPSACTVIPPPAAVCGNGLIEGTESCDDGNSQNNDGCTSCSIDPGYNCSGNPSVCTKPNICGDGEKAGTEACDDGNTSNDDGCSSNCLIETGWACSGEPLSNCTQIPGAICGNAAVEGDEGCDDGNVASNDGCASNCVVEGNYACEGSPSLCTPTIPMPVCGNGEIESGEACDDGNKNSGDGCSSVCEVETDYSCSGAPSVCDVVGNKYCICHFTGSSNHPYNTISISENAVCTHVQQHGDIPGPCAGDAIKDCKGAPPLPSDYPCLVSSNNLCGNGVLNNSEACDDGNKNSNDGCSSNCTIESGFSCTGTPSVCTVPVTSCGNGVQNSGEACDDGNSSNGDGCSSNCTVEPNYVCSGWPSSCAIPNSVCGNGVVESSETCDDGNTNSNDGCSSTCSKESGYTCSGTPNTCSKVITNDTNAGTVTVGKSCQSEIKVICKQITYGAGGPAIPVKMNRALNNVYFNNWMFNNSAVYEGETYTEAVASSKAATYKIKANAKYGSYNATYESTNKKQTFIWTNGSNPPPNIEGFGGQKPLNSCLAPYIDSSTQKIKLDANQSLIAMELGVDVNQYPTSTAADYQDLVVLITAKNCQ